MAEAEKVSARSELDSYLSKIYEVEYPDGSIVIRKESRQPLSEETAVTVDFLDTLSRDPHPNLLIPSCYSGEIGSKLIEEYEIMPFYTMDRYEREIKTNIKNGEITIPGIVNIFSQLTSALAYMHQREYVHRDVRPQNVFLQPNGRELQVTLFDYNTVARPYISEKGFDSWNEEVPPEIREDGTRIDYRYDVYQAGYMLRELTHNLVGREDPEYKPILDLPPDLQNVVSRAIGPQEHRQTNASEMLAELQQIQSKLNTDI